MRVHDAYVSFENDSVWHGPGVAIFGVKKADANHIQSLTCVLILKVFQRLLVWQYKSQVQSVNGCNGLVKNLQYKQRLLIV